MSSFVEEQSLVLPPGFRFHPTDEEIVTHYLYPKILSHGEFCATAMGDVDLNKCEPWDLPSKAKLGETEWYFFCQRDRKYPTGMRTNRATESGYWKATGKDKEIYRGSGRNLAGMKKTLVFYTGRAPKGEKTNWVMHEFRLEGKLHRSAKDEWVVCRVIFKNSVFLKNRGNTLLLDSPKLPPLIETANFPDSGEFDDSFEFREVMPIPSYFGSSAGSDGWDYPRIQGHDQNSFFDAGCYLPEEVAVELPATVPAIRRHCKAEQFSNTSMVSQDTGVSNAEISSVVSDHEIDASTMIAAGGGARLMQF